MEPALLYWHWIVLGIVLTLSEIFIGSFFIFWFGVSAIVVGIILLLLPDMTIAIQILIWAILSGAFALAWFKYLKPLSRDKTKAGLSKEALLGQVGQVISPPNVEKRGMIRFPAPVLGSDEWMIISNDALEVGDRVSVTELSGNSLIVTKA